MSEKTIEQHRAELRAFVEAFAADVERIRDGSALALERRRAEAVADGHRGGEFSILSLDALFFRRDGLCAIDDLLARWRKNGWL